MLFRSAGGEPLIVSKPEKFKTMTQEEILGCDPDFVVIFPCGYPISKSVEELKSSQQTQVLKSLRAYKEKNVFICDGNQFFNRPGPRITDSCEILAALLFPEKFKSAQKKHLGKSFIRWSDHEN